MSNIGWAPSIWEAPSQYLFTNLDTHHRRQRQIPPPIISRGKPAGPDNLIRLAQVAHESPPKHVALCQIQRASDRRITSAFVAYLATTRANTWLPASTQRMHSTLDAQTNHQTLRDTLWAVRDHRLIETIDGQLDPVVLPAKFDSPHRGGHRT